MKYLRHSFLLLSYTCTAELNTFGQEIYDVDSSWAVKSETLSEFFGDKQTLYNKYMEDCREAAGPESAMHLCDEGEQQRLRMNRLQPAGMRNYTELGFAKIRAPEEVFLLLAKFWNENGHLAETEWKAVNTYHNMWSSPPKLAYIENTNLSGSGPALASQIVDASRKVMEEWTGQHLVLCSVFGIRSYFNDSILAPHVDRNPLVTSAIINVAQDVDEDWPLEVWGHDGKPYNITMKPGDMVLYESHSILHGRPFPMRGRFYANIFVHFEPTGTLAYAPDTDLADIRLDEEGQRAIAQGLPPYFVLGSEWEGDWRSANPRGWEHHQVNVHTAANTANWEALKDVALHNIGALHEPDDNGWYPLHEAARGGHPEVAKFLLDAGADINKLTNQENGSSPLALARYYHGDDHPLVAFLKYHGALELEPEL